MLDFFLLSFTYHFWLNPQIKNRVSRLSLAKCSSYSLTWISPAPVASQRNWALIVPLLFHSQQGVLISTSYCLLVTIRPWICIYVTPFFVFAKKCISMFAFNFARAGMVFNHENTASCIFHTWIWFSSFGFGYSSNHLISFFFSWRYILPNFQHTCLIFHNVGIDDIFNAAPLLQSGVDLPKLY